MADRANKKRLLTNAAYVYSFDRGLYVNRDAKKAFSIEFIEDHTEDEIRACISEPAEGEQWRLYFNLPPSDSVRADLEDFLDQ